MKSGEPLAADRVVFAQVRTKPEEPWSREWINFRAKSLDEAMKVAATMPGVLQVYEVCWDPGFIT